MGVEWWDSTWGSSRSGLAPYEHGSNYINVLSATRLRVCSSGIVSQ